MSAGAVSAAGSTGGNVILTAGLGSSEDTEDGGNGGDVIIRGGTALGLNSMTDVGGDVTMTAGDASASHGGSIL
eukprot:scaffold572481_cov52-Prasinocladus_malaysianus.AAC.1